MTDTWTTAELEPYTKLIGLGLPDAVMVAHILDRKLDPKLIASLSPAIIGGMLRDQLGWTGTVMTDDLGAVAITSQYKRAEAIALAIEAGNDLLTFANQADLRRRPGPARGRHDRPAGRQRPDQHHPDRQVDRPPRSGYREPAGLNMTCPVMYSGILPACVRRASCRSSCSCRPEAS